MSSPSAVGFDRRDTVAVLRIDRPEALGALSRKILGELDEAIAGLAADPTVRAVVLTGTGRGFVAGADIGEYSGVDFTDFVAYQRLGRQVFSAVAALPQPVIAAVNGYALGGGCELTLCCDFRIASQSARFGLPEVKLGLLPGGSGTLRLSRVVGAQRAAELIMTGRIVTAAEAFELGLLLQPPTEPDDLLPTAVELAERLAAGAPTAVRRAKQLIRAGAALPESAAWDLEQAALAELFMTADAAEGISAFIDKRTPQFSPPASR